MIASKQIAFGKEMSGKMIPIEYLESTGTQWIDTGIYPNTTNTRLDIRFSMRDVVLAQALFGSRDNVTTSGAGNTCAFIIDGKIRADWTSGDGSTYVATLSANTWVDMSISGRECLVDKESVLVTDDRISFNIPYTLALYSIKVSNTLVVSASGMIGKIAYAKIYNNDTLMADFIPVRVGNVGYMYDRVSGQLFGNQGTGEFVLGPDLINYTAKDYIQDGLIAMWDGIENAGFGIHDTHNGMANLVDGSPFGDIPGGTIQENGLYTTSKISCANSATLNDYMTVEVCFDYTNTDRTSKNVFMFPTEGTASSVGAYSWNSNKDFRLYRSADWRNYTPSDANDRLKTTAVIAFRKASGQNLGQMLASFGYGGEYKTIQDDNSWAASYVIPDTGKIYICANGDLPILVHSVRLYSRALTAEEVAHNYEIDKQRFGI